MSEQELIVDNNNGDSDTIRISTEVIGILAGLAAAGIPGIAGMSGGIVDGIAERLGRRDLAKGIKVHMEEDRITLDLNVIVEYGVPITEAAKKLKQAVRAEVEKTTGLTVAAVNIHVLGIHLPAEQEE